MTPPAAFVDVDEDDDVCSADLEAEKAQKAIADAKAKDAFLQEMEDARAEGDQLEPAVEALVRAESWDTLTVKVVMKKLEQGEGLEEGALKPHKAKVKEAVDSALTWLDVQNILARTSDKIDADDASSPSIRRIWTSTSHRAPALSDSF